MSISSTTSSGTTRNRVASVWWQIGAAVIALGAEIAAVDLIANDAGPLWKRSIGFGLLTTAAILIVAGLLRRQSSRATGSTLVAVGVTPGIAPIVLFWYPPALAFGAFSIAVLVFAVNDAVDARRLTAAAAA